ncbi:hypothetical protein GCM10028774_40910 [Spirosoma jeollabukense]
MSIPFILVLLVLALSAQAQEGSRGNTTIFNGAQMTFFGNHNFLTGGGGTQPGIVGTVRSVPYGVLNFASTATSHVGANDANHVDGYVRKLGTGSFIFPTGDNSHYGPFGAAADGTTGAYFFVDPTLAVSSNLGGGNYGVLPAGGPFPSVTKAVSLSAVSTKEYWDINGANVTTITLTWSTASAIGTLTGNDLSKLTIAGWNGTQWVAIPSTVDVTSVLGGASGLTAGSITSTSTLVPDTYTAYTFAASAILTVVVSGQVWNDADGNLALNGAETGTNAGGPLYVNLVDATGTVVGSAVVAANGSYSLTAPASTTGLKLVLTNTPTANAPGTLPMGWANTGETVGTGNTAAQSTTLGAVELSTGTWPVTSASFGIEQLPTAGSGTATASNAGGGSPVTVPPSAFTSTTASTDTAPGSVTAIRITAFPSNVTSLTVNGTVYSSLPPGGIVVPTNGNGAPTVPMLVDPTTDGSPVNIAFKAIDNAGKESANTGTATLTTTVPPTATNDVATSSGSSVVINILSNDTPGAAPLNPTTVKLIDPATFLPVTTLTVANEGSYSVDPATGQVTFTPLPTFSGVATPVTYMVADQNGVLSNQATITVTVDAPSTVFPCSNKAYQVTATGAGPSSLYEYDLTTGTRSLIATLTRNVNAIGYNGGDNLIWGFDTGSGQVVRLDATGATAGFTIANLPNQGYNVGDVLNGGYLFLYTSSAAQYFVVDINPARPATYLKLVDPTAAYALDTAPFGTAVTPHAVNDWAYSPTTGLFYALTAPADANPRQIVTLNPTTAVTTLSGTPVTGSTIASEGTAYGASFVDNAGNFYVFANGLGTFYQINLATNTATLLSSSTPSFSNDGASCNLSPLLVQPILNPDANVTYVNIPVPGNVNTNDKVPVGTTYGTPTASGGNPSGGTITLTPDGVYSFTGTTPGSYSFTVPVCALGQTTACPTQPLVITVKPNPGSNTPAPPVANTDITSVQGSPTTPAAVILNVRANDGPGNPGGSLGTPTIVTPPAHGTVSVNPNGNIVYTPTPGYYGDDRLTYQVCESPSGQCTTAQEIIHVLPLGDPNSTLAADDYVATTADTPVSGNVKLNDTDPNGNTQTVSPQTTTTPAGSLTLNSDGSYTFIPASGASGPVSFTYTTCDNGSPQACANATLYILVAPGVPDLVPIIYILPTTQYGTTNFTVAVDVYNLLPSASTGLISVYVSKDPMVAFSFNGGLSLVGGKLVQNSIWTFDGTSNPNAYIFTTSEVINPGSKKSFGLTGILTPGNTQGTLSISTTIVGGSGGEVRINNNSDAEKIDYFKK